MSKTIVIAAGGSGGHIFPAQALADEMLKLKWNVIFVTDERGLSFVKKLSYDPNHFGNQRAISGINITISIPII